MGPLCAKCEKYETKECPFIDRMGDPAFMGLPAPCMGTLFVEKVVVEEEDDEADSEEEEE